MSKKIDSNQKAGADCAQRLVHPLRVIDLDSPFFWGVGRDMTDEERRNAEKHGRHDNPPMSVLGITDGLAAVDSEELARLFAGSPKLLDCVRHLVESDWFREGVTGDIVVGINADKMREALSEILGMNA